MILFLTNGKIEAQTDFAPGEIMFTGFDSDDPDGFSLVLLTDVVSGTTIFITDRGWDNTAGDGFRIETNGEGTISFTFTADYECGSEFVFTDIGGTIDWEGRDSEGDIAGTVAIIAGGDPDGPELGCSTFGCPDGDQLFIYQSPEPTPGSQGSFVTAIQYNGTTWNGDNNSNSNSEKPDGLAHNQVVRFNTELDNAKYNCETTSGLPSELRTAITNDNGTGGNYSNIDNNWIESDNNIDLNDLCGFCCGTSVDPPALSGPTQVTTNQMFTITISGSLSPGESWELYTAGCGVGTPVQTTTGSTFNITAPGVEGDVVYYVKSSEDLECPSECATIEVCVVANLLAVCTSCTANILDCGPCFLPAPFANPPMDSGCYAIKVIFILDESGSIGFNDEDVEDGVLAFLNSLNGQDAEVALIEFSTEARLVNNYTTVNQTYINNIDGYFNGVAYNGHTYSPVGGTNWHGAMIAADALASADIVMFFTDGEPTIWQNGTAEPDCGNGAATETPEIVNPVKIANKLKSEGTHMFMLGVGTGIVELNLQRMSGFVEYENGVNTLATSDYSIGNFEDLAEDLQSFILELCRTTIVIEKDVLGPVCNDIVMFRFRVINTGTESSATGVTVSDTFPAGYSNPTYSGPDIKICIGAGCNPPIPPNAFIWVPFAVAPGDTAELIISVTVGTGEYTNIGWVEADNAETDKDTFPGNLIVQDQPPTVSCPPNVTIECSASSLPPGTGTPTGSDPDGPAPMLTFTDVTMSGSCPQEYTIIRTWTATDGCSNTASCTQSIVVEDTTPPVVTCPPDVTITCLSNTSPAALGTATAADLCSPTTAISHADVTVEGICALEYTIFRTWTAIDPCGNAGTCLQTITIDDSTPPSIICPPDYSINCSASTLPTEFPKSTNNCGDPILIFDYDDVYIVQGGSPPCSIQRTWSVTDDCGNTSTCIQTITVVDNIAPVITCPVNVTLSCTSNTLPAQTGTATSTDNCDASPEIGYSDMITGGSCPQEFIINRIWTSSDECGNTATCTQIITIDDNIAPVLSCPPGVTIDCNANTLPANTGSATGIDNCDTGPAITFADVTIGGSCPAEYTISRTWTATDDCGNSSSCVQTIFIDDSTLPVLSCPPNLTIQCTASTLPSETGSASATDNCDPTPAISHADVTIGGGCPAEYTIQRTWTAMDDCGNASTCIQFIAIDDSTPPSITCPPDITIDCASNSLPANTGSPVSTDNCDVLPAVTFNDAIIPGSCPNSFTINRTWTTTDDCSNTNTCIQVIIVQDIISPVIICVDDITIECTESTLPPNTGNATASDNCDVLPDVSYTDEIAPGSCPQAFVITRTWTAEDLCGNTHSCVQIITVEDTNGPVLSCPADITIECTASSLPANTGSATALDNCDLNPVILYEDVTMASGICAYEYTITRTWSAEDACGNLTSCVQIITVDDSTPPGINCPANITITCTANTLPAATGEATATDNCDPLPGVEYSDVTVSGTCPQEYSISRTWIAEDACGNSNTCVQIITIEDNAPPEISCPDNVTIQCTESFSPDETGSPLVSDNCDADPVIDFNDVTLEGPSPNGYTIERTWNVTDGCGNSATCLQTIIVENPIDISLQEFTIDTICSGQSVTFEGMAQGLGNETYEWNFGSGSSPAMASGLGPHMVTYTYNSSNGNQGAHVLLTVTIPGCASVTDTVGNVHVNAIPNPAISGSTTNLCYFRLRTFKPLAVEMPGYTYEWDFGVGASIPPITGYGPHMVEYSTIGSKTVRLIVHSNEAGASCGDTATITFNVIACPGNITGRVRRPDGTGIPQVNVRLYLDNDLDGLPDGLPIRSVQTTSTGAYSHVGLAPGQYVVQEVDLPGYFSLFDEDESEDFDTIVFSDPNDNLIPVTMEANEVDAGNVFVDVNSPGIVNGYVFEDFDNDGQPDPAEGIAGVTIELHTDTDQNGIADPGGLFGSTVTTSIGFYTLSEVVNGDYVLVEIQPAGYNSQQDVDPSNDNDVVPNTNQMDDIIPVTITNGETDTHNYFKETSACNQLVTNTNDSGPGSLRYTIDCTPANDTVKFHATLAGSVIHLTTDRIIIDKNIYIHSNVSPRVMIYSDIEGAFRINADAVVEIKNLNFTSGFSGYPGAALDNYGELTLWDVHVYRNPFLLPGNYVIYNGLSGIITTKGNMQIEFD